MKNKKLLDLNGWMIFRRGKTAESVLFVDKITASNFKHIYL